jgi:hypothetical protein
MQATGRAAAPRPARTSTPQPSAPQPSADLDLSTPSASPTLPSPQPSAPQPSAPQPRSTQPSSPQPSADLDLSTPSASPTVPPAPSGTPGKSHPGPATSLDLSGQAPPAPTAKAVKRHTTPTAHDEDSYRASRTGHGRPTILTATQPVVTLTRIQSGVGALTFQAACSESVGDLLLGGAYQLVSGHSSVISHASGLRVAPAESRRPVITTSGGRFGGLTVDLARSRDLERLVIYAYSGSGAALSWDGALVVQTYGGSRIEVPLRRDRAAGVLVPLSLYNIGGELVLRAEGSIIHTSIREATAAFGFESIGWLDDHTPLS